MNITLSSRRLFVAVLLAATLDASATDFCGTAIAVSGPNVRIFSVLVQDDDSSFNDVGDGASEPGAAPRGFFDGAPFSADASAANTDMDLVRIDVTDGLGTLTNRLVMRYLIDGVSYYLPSSGAGIDFATVTSVTLQSVSSTTITSIGYHVYSLFEKLPAPNPGPTMDEFCGQALCVDRAGTVTSVVEVRVWDDDSSFNDVGDGANEGGALDPVGTIDGLPFTPNASHPQVAMDLVRIDVTDGLGTLTNRLVIRYLINGVYYYLPGSGAGIDFATATSATLQSVSSTTISSIGYHVYSLFEKLPAPNPDPSMDEFCGQALCVDRAGTVTSVVEVRVWDDDSSFNDVGDGANEGGALDPVGTIDGLPFTPNASHPQVAMDLVRIDVTDGLGTLTNRLVIRYLINGVYYYLPGSGAGIDFATATSATLQSVSSTTISSIGYHVYSLFEKLPAPNPDPSMDEFCGQALCVDRAGTVTSVAEVRVWDDDSSFNDVGDGANEGGALDPVGTIDGLPFTPNASHPQVAMDLVRIDVTDGLGTLTNRLVIRYLINGVYYYLPGSGAGIDFATATSATLQSVSSTTISSIGYHVYSLFEKLPAPNPDPSMDLYIGKALCVDRVGSATVVECVIWDDDGSFNDVGDGANEGGALDPVGTIDGLPFTPNADHPQTAMDLYSITVTDGLGTINGVFAIRYQVNGRDYYLPGSARGVAFASVTTVSSAGAVGTLVSNISCHVYSTFRRSPLGPHGTRRNLEALRVDRNGGLRDVAIDIWDDDPFFSNVADGDSEHALDPYGLIGTVCYFSPNGSDPGTVIRSVELDAVFAGGPAIVRAMEYVVGGFTYYLPLPDGAWLPSKVAVINSVTALDERPVITSGGSGSVPENAPISQVAYVATATDFEGEAPVFSITGGADAAFFAINPAGGSLTFLSSPDFENPQDGNSNNIYRVIVGASDGQSTVTRLVLITVTDRTGTQTYGDWIADCYPGVTDPAIIGVTADPDLDGTTNLFEFLYEGNAKLASNPGARPIDSIRLLTGSEIIAIDPGAAVVKAEHYFVVRMRRPKNLREWQVELVASPDLSPFGGGILAPGPLGPVIDEGSFWLEDRYLQPSVNASIHGYARVEITLP